MTIGEAIRRAPTWDPHALSRIKPPGCHLVGEVPTPVISAAIAFLLALLAALALTPAARGLARHLGAFDHAHSSRKVHGRPVPRLGGLAIVGAFFLALPVMAVADPATLALFLADRERSGALLVGGLVVAGLGLHDDLRGVTAGTKLAVELAVAGLLYAAGWRIDAVDVPFLEPIVQGWLGLPITLLWIAGVTNAVNLIDGLDGLAAGVAAVAALAIGLLAFVGGTPLVVLLAAALAGAALGFLRHNFNPASIFMGDTGSLFLGFVLAALSLRIPSESSMAGVPLAPVVVLGLPLADTALALLRRALRGAPLFRADRDHLHHRLLARGLGHRGTVLVLYAVSLLLAGAAVLSAFGRHAIDAVMLVGLSVACPAGLWRLGVLRVPRLAGLVEERHRNRALRRAIASVRSELRGASDWGDLWPPVRQAAEQLGAGGVELCLASSATGELAITWAAGVAGQGLLCTRSPLAQNLGASCLELRWRDRAALDRDTEIAVEILCGEVGRALLRIRRWRFWTRPAMLALIRGRRLARSRCDAPSAPTPRAAGR